METAIGVSYLQNVAVLCSQRRMSQHCRDKERSCLKCCIAGRWVPSTISAPSRGREPPWHSAKNKRLCSLTRSKRRWPPFREKQLGRHGKLCSGVLWCIAYLANFCHALSYFSIFYKILHCTCLGAFSVRLASDCQRVFCLLKSQGQFGQAKHDCGCLKVYTGKAKLYWDVVHFCTDQGTCCFWWFLMLPLPVC